MIRLLVETPPTPILSLKSLKLHFLRRLDLDQGRQKRKMRLYVGGFGAASRPSRGAIWWGSLRSTHPTRVLATEKEISNVLQPV
jgi:hypothetical protein